MGRARKYSSHFIPIFGADICKQARFVADWRTPRTLWGGAPNMCITFFPRSQTLSGHTSIIIGLQTENSAVITRGAAPQLKSAECSVCNPIVIEVWPLKVETFHKSGTHTYWERHPRVYFNTRLIDCSRTQLTDLNSSSVAASA